MQRLTSPLLAADNGLPLYSKGYALVELVHTYTALRLDDWQAELIIRVLEQCPPGHAREGQLRYRQVCISIPRQSGKSVIASVLALFGLLQHTAAPKVLGVARTAKQAGIVYGYAKSNVNGSEPLRALLKCAATPTIGINRRDAQDGSYVVLAGDNDALQGYPSTLAICDELHVMKPDIYDAIVTSQRAQAEPLLVGITTAGDLLSVLLKRLYAQGDAAIAGEQETFGFFCWESDSEEFTVESITEANPAVACGRISAQTIYEDERHTPKSNWQRFALNSFYEGVAEPWVPIEAWNRCAGTGLTDFKDCVYGIDITPNWSFATIVAAKKIDGVVHTAIVARLANPNIDRLKEFCMRLKRAGRCSFIIGGRRLDALYNYLEEKNATVERIGSNAAAASLVYGLIARGRVSHDGNTLVTTQHGNAKTKTYGDGFVIVRGSGDIDACYASVYAIFAAEISKSGRGPGIA